MNILLKRILLAFSAVAIFLLAIAVYAFLIEPNRLTVSRHDLKIPRWSPKLNNFKIVAISDVHGGAQYITEEKIQSVVELANQQNPDLIVLLGDYVSQVSGRNSNLKMPVDVIAKNLQNLRAKYGVYASVGNHDWWYDEVKVRQEFERIGINVLENEVEPLSVNGETVYLWGIEDYWKKRSVPLEVYEQIPDKRNIIAITHNPDSMLKAPTEVSLMFAGHTHGGQVLVPFYGAIVFVNDPRLMKGFIELEGRRVFVTTGVGTSGPPIRFGVIPEIAVLTLSSAD